MGDERKYERPKWTGWWRGHCVTCGLAANRCECERPHNGGGTDATHWVGCWRAHHHCAIAIIERLLDGTIADAEAALTEGGATP